MGRIKKEQGHEYENCRKDFEQKLSDYGLNEKTLNVKTFTNMLIDECMNLQGEICSEADIVNIDMFNTAKEITEIDGCQIDKGTYREFIQKTMTLKRKPVNDKTKDKQHKKSKQSLFIGQLRKGFNDTYLNTKTNMPIVTEINENIDSTAYEKSNDLQTLIENGADIRNHINNTLYKKYRICARAFIYATKGKYTYKQFKSMVDANKYGIIPNVKWGEKIYSRMQKFVELFTVMQEFNNVEFFNVLNDMGIEVKLKENNKQYNKAA